METVLVSRPMQWTGVPDISETPPLSQEDKDCLREVRDVLAKFDRLDRFGVNLIHKHFEIAEDEVLLESIDVDRRTLTVAPIKKADLGQAVETSWQLRDGAALIECPVWCSIPGGHRPYHKTTQQ